MAVISIVGCPGIGKSFLAKQLACADCVPAFFEGETGIFPESVLAVLNSEIDSKERYDWLLARYKRTLERAHRISELGIDCYADGDILTMSAWLKAEMGEKSPAKLKQWIEENKDLKADLAIVIYSSEQKIIAEIKKRGRKSEQNDFIIQRSLRVQRACIELAKKNKRAILIDRTDLDFSNPKTLQDLQSKIKTFLKG
ncbi:MAG: hypothetical protein V1866_01650 [archaeon]